ncbi:phosphoglycolate phosphatase [Phaeovulum sp. NW3]|uniref:phosphoglycolate phosphatase n=1 Tax=Phaeovulum sp. NW3 TaxID=2934933 RepID=UPI0020216C86|nr:phosphoglycolate phosphatase [Phaeovulum sp. NW3]MCL7464744.1 phosphoglycolate phosphatase [Phaeovulum sp. NW3]
MAAIIFDLDGTLVDSVPDIHAAVNRMLADHGDGPMDVAQVRSFIGNGVPALIAKVMAARGENPGDVARHAEREACFMRHYMAAPTDLGAPFPGVVAALDALAAAGHRLGVCTNKPVEPARAILRDLDLADRLPVVIGGDSLPVRKPEPAPLLAAAEALGGTPVIYVGDSEVDAETAQRAGLPFLLFSGGYRRTPVAELANDGVFDAFADLPGLVSKFR